MEGASSHRSWTDQTVNFTVEQEAATLWFHPHPVGATAAQVYQGLAGLLYIEDDHSKQLRLPDEYGVNDFPLIVQDKSFDQDNQLNYQEDTTGDGIQGDTLLVNGTLNPYLGNRGTLATLACRQWLQCPQF